MTDNLTSTQAILRARATALRARRRDDGVPVHRIACAELRAGGEVFLVPAESIERIAPLPPVARVPNTPAWVRGICRHRADLISVVDLAIWFETQGRGQATHLTVLRGPRGLLGLAVSEVLGFREIAEEGLSRPDPLAGRPVRGVTADHCSLIDVAALLERPEIVIG